MVKRTFWLDRIEKEWERRSMEEPEGFLKSEIHGRIQTGRPRYWRNKSGHEIDFVWTAAGRPPIAIECKWSADNADAKNIRVFRKQYPEGANLIVAQDVNRSYRRSIAGLELNFVNLEGLIDYLAAQKRV